MNSKVNRAKNQVEDVNIIEQHRLIEKAASIKKELEAHTWHDLETKGKFIKDAKIDFIRDDMLIVGCDIGSETHYIRAINSRGKELSKKPFSFRNTEEGFQKALTWMLELAAKHDKAQIVLGLEPTGHYWIVPASWMIKNGISVVQVNPYAVKQSKEIEDNSQDKNDRKDPKVIANLVIGGNFGVPYLPENIYADLRNLSMLRDQIHEDRIRALNRLHRELTISFPEYKDAFGKIEGAFCLVLLSEAPVPDDIVKLGEEGIRKIWKEAHLKGGGYNRAKKIYECADKSAGIRDGIAIRRTSIKWYVEQIKVMNQKLEEIEKQLETKITEIPHSDKCLEIPGIAEKTLSGILAEIGDISRFDDVKEIQKLSGLALVANSSGKHNGQSKISRRGRKRLRYWLYIAAKSVIVHTEEFKILHSYYTTREDNPLKKMQSIIAIACKLLRVIYAILTKGVTYDPIKMLKDIKHPEKKQEMAA